MNEEGERVFLARIEVGRLEDKRVNLGVGRGSVYPKVFEFVGGGCVRDDWAI